MVDEKEEESAVGYVDDVAAVTVGKDFQESNDKMKDVMERPGGGFDLARQRGLEFAVEKFAVILCSRKREPAEGQPRKTQPIARPDLTLVNSAQQYQISPSAFARFLGLLIDQELRFKEHTALALKKGMAFIGAFRRLIKMTRGTSAIIMRRFYLAIAVPRMLYAASVFLFPPQADKIGSKGHLKMLNRVQRYAAIQITGAMSTTATDVTEAHAGLLPFHLLVDKVCHREVLRLATLPKNHPLHPIVRNAAARTGGTYRSPLQEHLHTYPIDPNKVECIPAVRLSPKWKPAFTSDQCFDRDQVLAAQQPGGSETVIYTDGSCIDEGIGAAAVLYVDGICRDVARFRLGSETKHTVYDGELVGLILGINLLKNVDRIGRVYMKSDSQAAIQALSSVKSGPGSYLLDFFHDHLETIRRGAPNLDLVVSWLPAHRGIAGNERCDLEAKQAARGADTPTPSLPEALSSLLRSSKSVCIQQFTAKLKESAAGFLAASPRYERLHRIDPSLPSDSFLKLIGKLPRRQAALLVQLRTGHAPLRKHLYDIQRVDSPICEACNIEPETVLHFLVDCRKRDGHRLPLTLALGRAARSVPVLLSSPDALPPLFQYINQTQRFRSVFGDLS